MIAVSRGPLDKLLSFENRMGWTFKWVSSMRSDFNFDYHVSFDGTRSDGTYNYAPRKYDGPEMPGISVFYKDESGAIFHTYSTYGRGLDMTNAAYQFLDLVPKGRDEGGLPYTMAWLRYRDQYDDAR
jgi:predicted dithiol-disulfide oxidoreductase (DUF899 family)